MKSIYLAAKPEELKVLRTKTKPYDFTKHTPKETAELVKMMKETMHSAQGIGLSANQIGLDLRVFVGQVPNAAGKAKFYAIFNPAVEALEGKVSPFEEGCLSIPGVFGPVERTDRVLLTGYDKHGKPVRIKAWGLLARMFQHEVDHLNGMLFTDRATATHE